MSVTSPHATTALDHPSTENVTATVVVTNTCQCMWCDECAVMFEEDPAGPDECPECGTDTHVTFGDCGGTCYERAIEDLAALVGEWTENNPSVDNEWVITGAGMGWRALSGTKHVDLTCFCPSEAINVNSEWTQTWTIDTAPGGSFTAVQSHHDAMGESYTVTPLR